MSSSERTFSLLSLVVRLILKNTSLPSVATILMFRVLSGARASAFTIVGTTSPAPKELQRPADAPSGLGLASAATGGGLGGAGEPASDMAM